MSGPTGENSGPVSVQGLVAQAQIKIGIDPKSEDAKLVQTKIFNLVEEFRNNNIDPNAPINKVTNSAAHCGDLQVTLANDKGDRQAGIVLKFTHDRQITDSLVAKSDENTENSRLREFIAAKDGLVTIETDTHTVSALVGKHLCSPSKI